MRNLIKELSKYYMNKLTLSEMNPKTKDDVIKSMLIVISSGSNVQPVLSVN